MEMNTSTRPAEIDNKDIYDILSEIKNELDYIREHMVDIDVFLIPEEEIEIKRALDDYGKGEFFSFDEIENERV